MVCDKVGKYGLCIVQGSDNCDLVFTVTNKDGSPIDLSGYTGRLQIRPNVNSDELFDDLSSANGRVVIDTIIEDYEGEPTLFYRVTCKFPNLITTGYTFLKGVYDLELYTGSFAYRFLEGDVTVNKEVTRQ
jgi:hypothetical protein